MIAPGKRDSDWLDGIFNNWNCFYKTDKIVDLESKTLKQQILAHINENYVPKPEVEKRLLEADIKARNDFWNKLELSYIADVISGDLVGEDFKKLVENKIKNIDEEIREKEKQLKGLDSGMYNKLYEVDDD